MSKQNRDNPKNIALMSVAAVAGVGFAVWNISNTLAPPPAASKTPEPASVPKEKTQATACVASSAEPNKPTSVESSEADLALNADPFVPLPEIAPKETLVPVPTPRMGLPTELPNLQRVGYRVTGNNLPSIGLPGAAPSGSASPSPNTEVEAPPPVLVGTLLGERPCAVFRADQQLSIIPIGGKFGAWKVVSVNHGGVVVKNSKRTMRLGIGTGKPQGTTHSTALPEERAVAQTHRYVPQSTEFASAKDLLDGSKPAETPEKPLTLPEGILPKEETHQEELPPVIDPTGPDPDL